MAPVPPRTTDTARTRTVVAGMFLVSGASGLVFEVVWVRQLARLVGHSTVAVSLVVAVFLLGLVPGAAFLGARADRHPRPLLLFARLEACVGVSALAVTAVLARVGDGSTLGWLPTGLPWRLALATALLAPPTMAMGATLPVLTRTLTRDPARAGGSFGRLYAVNTLGAAAGCALAGFVAIGRLGLVRTAAVAAVVDLAVALCATLCATWFATFATLADRGHPPPVSVANSPDPLVTARTVTHPVDEDPARAARVATALAAVTGFAAIACEVLWFRVLASFLKASTYAFTVMLVTYLLGLVVGGAVYARSLSRYARPWSLLADTQLLVAFTGLLSVAMLSRAPGLVGLVHTVLGRSTQADADLPQMALAAMVVGLPAAVLGAAYPVLASLGAQGSRGVAGGIGGVAAANTLGGAAGSLVTALLLLPALGAQRSFGVVLALSVAVALVARQRCDPTDPVRGRVLRGAVVFAVAWLALPADGLVRAVTDFPRARVLAVREGRDGTLAALGYTHASVCTASPNHCARHCGQDFAYQQLVFGAVSYASTILPARRYMRALAHLPMLVHPDPGTVLEVCFGTGTTAGAFVTHPTLRVLTVVDINPDVFALAPWFEASNHGVLRDPRTHTVAEDGRRYLATHPARVDVISLEPPPPTADGAAVLYTREFYQQARQRMAPGGILAQWVPLDQQSDPLDRALVGAVSQVFTYTELWIPSRWEAVVLASDQPLTVDLARWRGRWQTPAVARSLAEVGFPSPEALLATRVLDTAGVRAWVGTPPAVTDDRPVVSYYRAWPGDPLDLTALGTHAVTATTGVTEEPVTVQTVRRYAAAEGLQRLAHGRMLAGDDTGAQALAQDARMLAGDNPYTVYLTGLEYDCLDRDAP